MAITNPESIDKSSWMDAPVSSSKIIRWETVIFILLIGAAIFSRFYDIELRRDEP